MTPKPVKKKLVEIQWVDAEAEAGWTKDDPKEQEVVLKTYGLLVRKDKTWVVHADTYAPDSTHPWSGRGKIPVGMVRKIKVIATVEI